jgi:hypothetical protein
MLLVLMRVALDLGLLWVFLSCDWFLNLTGQLAEQPGVGVLNNLSKQWHIFITAQYRINSL